jgi:hypothetical protein
MLRWLPRGTPAYTGQMPDRDGLAVQQDNGSTPALVTLSHCANDDRRQRPRAAADVLLGELAWFEKLPGHWKGPMSQGAADDG